MSVIASVTAREILDSRANPTVEVDVVLAGGVLGRAIVPSGASTGAHEALELRDGDKKRYRGRGVKKAIENIQSIIGPAVVGMDALEQVAIDHKMIEIDGTPNKKWLGANATLGVSLACAHAAAAHVGLPLYAYLGGVNARVLPVPMMNILNGGKHADNNVDLQEFMVIPAGAPSFSEALRMGAETYHALRATLKARGHHTGTGDEGGFAPDLTSNEEALSMIVEAIKVAGYEPGKDIFIGIDAAATEFYKDGKYVLSGEHSSFSAEELIEVYARWADTYPLVSIEDGLAEDDWENWPVLTKRLGERLKIIGDDITVTSQVRVKQAIEKKALNTVLMKLNQIGTLTETVDTIMMTRRAGLGFVVSHRSGETEDVTVADFSCAMCGGLIKSGAPARTDRVAKYNQLLRIEEQLGDGAIYAGMAPFAKK